MIKLFVTDLDHTLLNDERTIDPKDQEAIDRLITSGVQLAIATGRSDAEFRPIIDLLQHPYHRISQNGVFVRTDHDEELYSARFSHEIAQQMVEEAEEYAFQIFVNVGDQTITPMLTEEIKQYTEAMALPVTEDKAIFDKLSHQFQPGKLSFIGKSALLQLFMKKIDQTKYRKYIDFFLSSSYCVDIVPKGVSKASGIQHLINRLGFTKSEVACIGDSYNDTPMLQLISPSFAMRHADLNVQKSADHVVDSVAEAIDCILKQEAHIS